MADTTEERRLALQSALDALGEEVELSGEQQAALSMLEGGDLEAFRVAWSALAGPARARVVRALARAAEQRLRLDFAAINHLAIEDRDPEVRLAGVESALEDRAPSLLERLVRLARQDDSAEVRRAATEDLARFALLGELEDLEPDAVRRVRGTLLEALHDVNEAPGVRSAALAALGYFGEDEIGEELATAFTDPALRAGAIRGMGRSADPRWTERLLPVLGSEDPEMRLEAARALDEIEDDRAVGPLTDLIDDPELDVRLAAIHALGALGGEEAREALLYALESRDELTRQAAERAVSDLEEAEAGLDL